MDNIINGGFPKSITNVTSTEPTLQQPAEKIKTFHLSKTDKPCYIKGEIRSE